MKMQKADWRVLNKAKKQEIMIIGAFGGNPTVKVTHHCFDSRRIVERNIARGFIEPGEYFNKYKITKKGENELSRHNLAIEERRKAKEAKRSKKESEPA
ncbi:hypothetical protein ACLEIY_15980 [Acetobacter tropicalis]|uniref:hypothetical protein n=1 Tax=Acetobacter tropicalis TaxID=104102 RepID=UPI003975D18B